MVKNRFGILWTGDVRQYLTIKTFAPRKFQLVLPFCAEETKHETTVKEGNDQELTQIPTPITDVGKTN